MGRVVAMDGPSGAGKSTVAKAVSEALGFQYLDTGALYRATAHGLLRKGIKPEDSDEDIRAALRGMSIVFTGSRVFVDSEDVSGKIRTTEMGHYSSVFSARAPVREKLLPVQRAAAGDCDLVAEGRDMTTVVFADAWKKFYIDANVPQRAKRRYLQLKEKGGAITMEQAGRDVAERDRRDSSRSLAPLRKAQDAILIDTSTLSQEEVISKVLRALRENT